MTEPQIRWHNGKPCLRVVVLDGDEETIETFNVKGLEGLINLMEDKEKLKKCSDCRYSEGKVCRHDVTSRIDEEEAKWCPYFDTGD